jgi:hypothetical protein
MNQLFILMLVYRHRIVAVHYLLGLRREWDAEISVRNVRENEWETSNTNKKIYFVSFLNFILDVLKEKK